MHLSDNPSLNPRNSHEEPSLAHHSNTYAAHGASNPGNPPVLYTATRDSKAGSRMRQWQGLPHPFLPLSTQGPPPAASRYRAVNAAFTSCRSAGLAMRSMAVWARAFAARMVFSWARGVAAASVKPAVWFTAIAGMANDG